MSLRPEEMPNFELSSALLELAAKGRRELDSSATGDVDAAVHEARKCVKKIRALLALMGPATLTLPLDRHFRDIGRLLSPLRDQSALAECLDRLADTEDDPDLRAAIASLAGTWRGKAECAARQAHPDAHVIIAEAVNRFRNGEGLIRKAVSGFCNRQTVEKALRKTYRRARRQHRKVELRATAGNLHEWRKLVKSHLYQVQAIASRPGKRLRCHLVLAEDLAACLGNERDLHLLERRLRQSTGVDVRQTGREQILERVVLKRGEQQQMAMSLGRKLFDTSPRQLRRSIRRGVGSRGGES